ncbi:MAG: glycosyltransferase family 10 [Candidatus Cloacimonetes bacterium]|nr:glycosyltransferase family 10 [Candidatus Cloacimonadota bacterium]
MKTKLKLNYTDFWAGFNKTNNYFHNILKQHYEIEICDKPDFLIYSVFGKDHLNYKCVRILYSAENRGVDFTRCDYAFTSDYNPDPKHYRLPFYVYCYPPESFVKPDLDYVAMVERKFCSFIVSNPGGKVRNRFHSLLSNYKPIASGGKFRNNIGYRVPDKEAFIRDFKFNLAFENRSFPGYTTEKIMEPFVANTVPIYWGNPLIKLDFNPQAFLDYHAFKSEKAFVKHIIEVDNNPDLYLQYLKAPRCENNHLPDQFMPQAILARFHYIFSAPISPVANKPQSLSFFVSRSLYRLNKMHRRGYL